MKATIRGVHYDTDKSKAIASHRHGSPGDASHWSASLYLTRSGSRYFLAGKGGPMTIFAGQERIIRLSPEDANAWSIRFAGCEAI